MKRLIKSAELELPSDFPEGSIMDGEWTTTYQSLFYSIRSKEARIVELNKQIDINRSEQQYIRDKMQYNSSSDDIRNAMRRYPIQSLKDEIKLLKSQLYNLRYDISQEKQRIIDMRRYDED